MNEQQILISSDVTDQTNDVRQVQPMLDQISNNLNSAGATENRQAFNADAGYSREENVTILEQHDRAGRKTIDPIPEAPSPIVRLSPRLASIRTGFSPLLAACRCSTHSGSVSDSSDKFRFTSVASACRIWTCPSFTTTNDPFREGWSSAVQLLSRRGEFASFRV